MYVFSLCTHFKEPGDEFKYTFSCLVEHFMQYSLPCTICMYVCMCSVQINLGTMDTPFSTLTELGVPMSSRGRGWPRSLQLRVVLRCRESKHDTYAPQMVIGN